MKATIHQLHSEPIEQDLTERFRQWWRKQDGPTRAAIREIVQDDHKPGTREDAIEVLKFLNLATGKRYRPVEANLRLIRARLASATVQQCKAVIAIKKREWMGTEMEYCLRPATLFNATKFEQYMGDVGGD